jgi:uncharacterized membrane protein
VATRWANGTSSGKNCGARQAAAQPAGDFLHNLSGQNAALLCYIPWVGWIAAIAVLASNRFRADKRVHFHAFQGLYLWVASLLIAVFEYSSIGVVDSIPRLLHLAVLCAWIFMLVKVHQGEDFHLPLIGELAERSVAEQRS